MIPNFASNIFPYTDPPGRLSFLSSAGGPSKRVRGLCLRGWPRKSIRLSSGLRQVQLSIRLWTGWHLFVNIFQSKFMVTVCLHDALPHLKFQSLALNQLPTIRIKLLILFEQGLKNWRNKRSRRRDGFSPCLTYLQVICLETNKKHRT